MSEEKKSPKEGVLEALKKSPGSTAEELANQAGLGLSTVRKALVELKSEGETDRTAGGREAGRKLPDTWTMAVPVTVPAEPKTADRLSKGRLVELILEHLRSCPAQALSPGSVGKAIGHSAGAISNALRKMAEKGEVTEVSEKPRRYSINA